MNRSFKCLSLSIVLLSLFASAHTHSMHVKKLAKTSTFYSLRQKHTSNKPILNPTSQKTEIVTSILPENDKKQSGIKIFCKPATKEDLEKFFTASEVRLHKLESDTLDTQNQLDAIEKSLNAAKKSHKEMQKNLNAIDSDIHTLQKCIEKIESRIETLESEVIYWEPMTPEMKKKFCQGLAIALEDHERQMRDGGGVY